MPDIFVARPGKKNTVAKVKTPKIKSNRDLSSFLFMPDGMRFETQEPGEVIILLLRRHGVTNLPWLLTGLALIIFPVIILPLILINRTVPAAPPFLFNSIILLWYLFTFSYLLVNFILWYFTVSIVSNERIIDIDFLNVLHKKFSETRIAKVEDVTQRTGGFIQAFFNYGDVFVQTAANEQVFQFHAVPQPDEVVRIINQLMGKEEEENENK